MTEEEISVQEQYEEVLNRGDDVALTEFLNDQNISDVADLIYENEEQEISIFTHLSMHRALGLFKILEHPTQKRIIKNLPPNKAG
jgi:magnesium transporter